MSAGINLAVDALHHFLGTDASRAHAAAALDIWRHYHPWKLDTADIPAVLDQFDTATWPRSVHHHHNGSRHA